MSNLTRYLYGSTFTDTPTPPRRGERIEFKGTVREWLYSEMDRLIERTQVLPSDSVIRFTRTYLRCPGPLSP